jgi:hypothetical protein
MVLRPDEEAAQANMQRERRFSENINKGVSSAVSLGGAALGASTFSKVLPFLSEHIPLDMAIKGISKVSPKVGDFLRRGQESGLDLKEGLEFIKEKISGNKQNLPEEKNAIQMHSQKLFDLVEEMINQGSSPMEAAAKISSDQNSQSIIKQMEKEYKADWYSIVESIFGKGDSAKRPQEQQTPHPNSARGQQMAREAQQGQQAAQPQGQQSANWDQIAQMLKQTLAS